MYVHTRAFLVCRGEMNKPMHSSFSRRIQIATAFQTSQISNTIQQWIWLSKDPCWHVNHGVMAFDKFKCITAQGFVVNLVVGLLNLDLVQGSRSFYIRQQQDSELTASKSTRAWQVLGPQLMHM